MRSKSRALWERIGTCLGCDGDLLSAGDEEQHPDTDAYHYSDVFEVSTTAGSPLLSAHPDEVMYDEHVVVEGLSPFDPEDPIRQDSFVPRSARFYEDVSEAASPMIGGPSGGLMDVVEEDEERVSDSAKPEPVLTPAQVAGGRGDLVDPINKHASFTEEHHPELSGSLPEAKSARSKSFVGIQISTPPSLPLPPNNIHRPSSSIVLPGGLERGPGHPLFPTSFSTLSLAPTLPNNNPALKASLSFSQAHDARGGLPGNPAREALQKMMGWSSRKSRSGVSESEFTL